MDNMTLIELKHQIRIAINNSKLPYSIVETVLDAIKGEVLNAEMESLYASMSAPAPAEPEDNNETVIEEVE